MVLTAKGTLGLITLNNDVFICMVTGSIEVANVRPGETVQKIYSVEFYCLNRPDYDHTHGDANNPYPGQTFQSDDADYGGGYDQTDSTAEHPFHALKKLLSGGNFYYSVDFDLTRRLQDRAEGDEAVDISSLDEGLLWNSYMISPLLQFRSRLTSHEREALDHSRMLTSTIRGFVKTLQVPPSSAPLRKKVSNYPSTLTLISRLSSRRAGTRFNSRGIDDDGNVANFVETETVFWSPTGVCFSYTQIRGSTPVFWESSSSLIPGQQKIQITRSPEATQPAFDKHFERLERTYGAVHIVNLLSAEKPGEIQLSDRYRYHTSRSPLMHVSDDKEASDAHLLRETEFDFHEQTRNAGGYEGAQMIKPFIESSAEAFVYFMTEEVDEQVSAGGKVKNMKRLTVIMQQNGVFRVNCLDCLDRTNLIQTIISQMALQLFLSHRSEAASSDFWMRHSSLWADNGDTLSKIYAGTGALKSSFTRHGKMSLAGAIADARKSATRLYVNNFADKGRQNTIDLLLGRLIGQTPVHLYDPINDYVVSELNRKAADFTSSRPIYMWVGTFNLNGKTTGIDQDLSPWLHAQSQSFHLDYDVYAIGFQEIVELSPQQIMSTDPAHRARWEQAVKASLNENPHRLDPEDEYVLLRSGQLVGAALMIFVKASVLSSIKNVEGSIKKTGLSGIAGNKGAVAIRMDFSSTSVCFVTAHLAAGFANYEERNRDYKTISHGLRFQKDRTIEDHDSIIWLGDFNYRVGLSDDRARHLVKQNDLDTLYENDQLNIQMVAGMTFPFYSEARITFPPTYKFDLGTDTYDTSEKGRIPAWTDRVLRKGTNLKQIEYNSAPLRFSDHRPVFATFECTITIVDEAKKLALNTKLYEKRKADVLSKKTSRGSVEDDDSSSSADAEDLMGYESIAPDLPPASSDRRKWWLDGDARVRSQVGPPRDGMHLNPRREGNPWRSGVSKDDDWIEVERPSQAEKDKDKEKPQPPPPRGSRRIAPPPWEGERLARQAGEKMHPRADTSSQGDGSTEMKNVRAKEMLAATQIPQRAMTVGSNSPRSRTPSITSTTSKKQPPLKPTKPAALTSTPSVQEETPPPLPVRRDTSSSLASSVAPSDSGSQRKKLPPPFVQARRSGTPVNRIVMMDNEEAETGPPLPPRRVTDLSLMDQDGGEELGGFKALVPK
jgi:SacI homology domain/Endonuclease/Exonuclease/phosphatase family